MARYTIVYVNDEYRAETYGSFATRDAAEKRAQRMQRDLDGDRDEGGDRVAHVEVCLIQRLSEWT